MMNCAKCKKPLATNAKLCGNCGTVVGAVSQPSWSVFTPPTFTPPPPPPAAHHTQHGGPSFGVSATPAAVPNSGGQARGLVARATNILVRPKSEWPVIAGEPTTARAVYLGYVTPLLALGIVASFLGSTLVGVIDGGAHVRTGITAPLIAAVVDLVFSLLGVYLLARVVDRLVSVHGGQRDPRNALRVTAYSLTPAWVAGILAIVPPLQELAWLPALYGVYLLYLGLPVMMRVTQAVAIPCAVLAAAVALALQLLIGAAAGLVTGVLGAGVEMVLPGVEQSARKAAMRAVDPVKLAGIDRPR